ncbi:MAG: DUF460 domain-containing protein [archaeon]
MPKETYGIVGFDPGNTCAIGIVDFQGNVVFVKSIKGASFEDCVKIVGDYCIPAVFASDVFPVQGATRKLAGAFSCRTWCPELSLGVADKREIVSGRKLDVHERDALAAALFCLGSYSGLFDRARKKSGEKWETRVFQILKGALPNLSFEEAAALEKTDGRKGPEIPIRLKMRILSERVRFLENSLLRLRAKNGELEIALGKKLNLRARVIEKVSVENRETVRAVSFELENAKRIVRSLAGGELTILEKGAPANGCVYVGDCSMLSESDIFRNRIKVVVCETGRTNLPCKIVKVSGQSIFNGEFVLVDRTALEIGKESEKAWAREYLAFVSR